MFKSYGLVLNNENSIEIVAGPEKQRKEGEKEVYYSDGSYGAVKMDCANNFELHEMDYTTDEFKAVLEAFRNGVFQNMGMVLTVKNTTGGVGYLGCTDINTGSGVVYFENEISAGVPVKDDFFNSDAEGDEYWEEYLAYTDAGRII